MSSNVRSMLVDYLVGSGDLRRNFVKNPIGRENAINITVSGTATVAQNTTTPLTSESDIQITTTAVDDYAEFETNSLDRSMHNQNCEVKFDYKMVKGADATVVARLMNGSNIEAEVQLISEANVRPVSINFACSDPSTADYKVRIVQTVGVDTSTINVANVYLGKATNIGLSQQAELYGTAYDYAASLCLWAHSSTSWASFSADSDCNLPTTTGKISQPATKVPAILLENAPAGKYKVTAIFKGDGSTGDVSFRLYDGTNYSSIHQVTSPDAHSITLVGVFDYSTSGDRTIEIQGRAGGGDVQVVANSGLTPDVNDLSFTVVRFPTDAQTVLTPELGEWRVDANIGGANIDLGTGAVSTYQGMTNSGLTLTNNTAKGSHSSVKIPCSSTNSPTGSTCSTGDESNGVSFEVPQSGMYRACVSFSNLFQKGAGTSVEAAFQVVETPNNAQTITQEGGSRMFMTHLDNGDIGGIGIPMVVCGNFKFDTAGQKTLRLMYEKGTTTQNLVLADESTATGQRDIHWTVERLTADVKAVVTDISTEVSAWSGYHDHGCSWSATSSTYSDPSNDTTCTFTEKTNSNFGTVTATGASTPGVSFTPKSTGLYRACANFLVSHSTDGARQSIAITDVNNNVLASASPNAMGASREEQVNLCGQLQVNDLSAKEFKLRLATSASTMTLGRGAASGNDTDTPSIEWDIQKITKEKSIPTESVQTNSSVVQRIESAFVHNGSGGGCTSSPCTVTKETGDWISSVTRSGTGDYTITFNSGVFSNTPNCTLAPGDRIYNVNSGTTSATNFAVVFRNYANAASDTRWDIICMGPRGSG